VQEPVFESQTKTKLGSQTVFEGGPSMKNFIQDFLSRELDNFLHRNTQIAEALKKRIEQSERERKELAGIKKLANERAKKANLHNKKLRDCHVHLNDELPSKNKEAFIALQNASTVFITEGDSASGSITKARNVETQAVFSLRGKPLNCYGLTKKIVYENEEFNLLQHALNIEEGLEGLRYNNVVIATDADVDGKHIRLLIMTFFLQFFPDLVKKDHVHILETPLFRVRDKKETIYCYDETEKQAAKKKAAMLSLGIKKNRQAAGWRGLSVDLITNPDDHPVLSSKENEDQKDDNHVGPDERMDGMTVKYIWGASKLEKEKLRAIWSECDPSACGSLDRDSFVKGMWRIDEELRRAQFNRQTSRIRLPPPIKSSNPRPILR